MNIRKNLIIFTLIKIPPSNLPNKSKKEFLKFSYTSIKVSMDYLKLQPKSIQNMNIRKNLIIFTITKIPTSNLPNKSKKEILKSSYTYIKVPMDYLKLQPKSIQNMNIRKNLIIFTITKIPPSNLPNKSKKEFLLNPKMKNYKLHQALQKLSQ